MAALKKHPSITHQRCHNHFDREAAARCPKCRRYFCRECVSEHEGRVLCATCLAGIVKPRSGKRFPLRGMMKLMQAAVGFLVLWMVFYLAGRMLFAIPATFHETILW